MNLGLIGAGGYWGRRLLECAVSVDGTRVVGCSAYSNMARLVRGVGDVFGEKPRPALTLSTAELLANPEVDAVIIAAPAETHYAIAKEALRSQKHVFVEKPLCLSSVEAAELARLAREQGRTLLVDHTYLFSKCLKYMRTKVDEGFLGEPLFVHSNRNQIGIYRAHGVLWDLAPHDISILTFLFPEEKIVDMSLRRWTHFTREKDNPGETVADAAHYSIEFSSALKASGYLSWCHPKWARDLAVVGTKGMLLFENNTTVKAFRCESHLAKVPEKSEWVLHEEHSPDDNPLRNAVIAFRDLAGRPEGEIPRHLRPEFACSVVATIEALEKSA